MLPSGDKTYGVEFAARVTVTRAYWLAALQVWAKSLAGTGLP